MLTLYHHPVCPLSRQIRVFLKELDTEFTMVKEDYWLRRKAFIEINPAGSLPVIEINKISPILVGNYSIIEYMVEKFDDFYFMPKSIEERALVRKYIAWFNDKFYREVSKILIDEKMIRLLMHAGGPRSAFIRAAKANLNKHFKLISDYLGKRSHIALEKLSCADVIAASHISIVDYFGEINWDSWPIIKEWYAIIKSRPAFQTILQDRVAGFVPPAHYANLDF
ncbi:MAG: glutathione S-transferase family protein [Rickettsiaceae bacterium]|nr:glutathione S-transferase family protein [Rickettsiaceae bacterium]